MEDVCCHPVPPPVYSHKIPWCAPQILDWPQDKDNLSQYQSDQQLEAMMEEFLYEILLELNKAYNEMDRNICLDILEGYIA